MKILNQNIKALIWIAFSVGMVLLLITNGFSQDVEVGPGYNPIQRARNVANPSSMPSNQPPPNITPNVSPDEIRRFNEAAPQIGQEGNTPTTPTPPKEEKKYTVIEGVHEWCVKCGKELRKPKRREVLESQLSGFYDDGTHGDEVAGDGIYSNITEERDRLCDQCWEQLQSYQRLIEHAQQDSPVEFYMVYSATEDPQTNPPSPIPTYGYWASRRDGTDGFFSDYTTRIFAPFKDPITKEFYKHYQLSPEELAELAALAKRKKMEQMRSRTGQYQPYQSEMGGPGQTMGEGQPEQYRSSYFGERQGGGK
ncbi:MAG: choice-of-anchor X domain-containing protein [bacterium]